jgi:hypothetical protein
MFDFLMPRHLRYRSMEEWRERENITSFRYPENPRLEARLQQQFEELRRHLWKRHLKQLTAEERKEIKAGKHPSQSHRHIEQARAIFEEFRSRVAGLSYVAEVSMAAWDKLLFESGWARKRAGGYGMIKSRRFTGGSKCPSCSRAAHDRF